MLREIMCNVVASCVRKSFTDDQFLIAYLLQECVMVRDRDGLAKLPDCFTVVICVILLVTCLHFDCFSLSLFLNICTPCTISVINK